MIRGEVQAIFRDVNTGEITKEFTNKNVITESMLSWMVAPSYSNDAATSTGQGKFGQYIFLSDLEHRSDRHWVYMYNPIAIGRTESGIQNPNLLEGNVGTGGTPAWYIQHQQRFDPPATTRNITVIGIGRWDQNSIPTNRKPIQVGAYLPLTTACIQTPTETLDIFYRIIFDNPDRDTDDTTLSRQQSYRIARRHIYSGSGYINDDDYYPYFNFFYYQGKQMPPNTRDQYTWDGNRGNPRDVSFYSNGGYRARIMTLIPTLSDFLGQCIGSAAHGLVNTLGQLFYNPLLKDSDSPIQNIFSHSASATKPFFDSTTAAIGDGTLSLNGDAWTNPDWNKIYRLDITGSGNASTATYKLSIRNVIGFVDNTYVEGHVSLPFLFFSNNQEGMFLSYTAQDPLGNNSGGNQYGAYCTPYSNDEFLAYTHHKLSRVNCMSGKREFWHSTTTPAADFQDISQVHVEDNGDIWVADAITGLFHITADGTTVTQFDNTHTNLTGITSSACYGVARTPGRIWCIMHDSLIYTTDGGTTFTVHNSGSSPAFSYAPSGQENRYWFLQGDPNHADHRLAVSYNDGTTISSRAFIKFYWWDSVSGHIATTPRLGDYNNNTSGTPVRRRELFNFFHCSPNDGVWGSRTLEDANTGDREASGIWNFGATQESHLFSSYGDESNRDTHSFYWGKDINGDDAMLLSRAYPSNRGQFSLNKQDGTRDSSSVYQNNNNPDGSNTNYVHLPFEYNPKCILPSGIFIGSTEYSSQTKPGWYAFAISDNNSASAGNFHNVTWKDYGWDGANWVEGNPNSKTMHTGQEALIDGVTVAWDDAGGTQSFNATDYYTVGVVDGVLVDGGVEFNHQYALYYKKVIFDETDVDNSGVLPATTSTASRSLNEAEQTVIIDGNNMEHQDPDNRFKGISSGAWSGRLYGALKDKIRFRFRTLDLRSGDAITIGLDPATDIGTTVTASNINYALRITHIDNNNWKVEVFNNGTLVHVVDDPGSGQPSYSADFNADNDIFMYHDFVREEGSTDLELYVRNQLVWTFTGVSGDLVPSVHSTYRDQYVYWNHMGTYYDDYHIALGNSGLTTGSFHPQFWAIDWSTPGAATTDQIKIDGTPVTNILVNDYGRTPLAAGEIEILTYQGKIRYSAADVGKTLTFDRYNVMLNES